MRFDQSRELWQNVDQYVVNQLHLKDPILESILADANHSGLPEIHVSTCQGMLLYLLAKSISAKRILEIGTLAGFSTTYLARALGPQGKLITLELDPKHAQIARQHLDKNGFSSQVEIKIGPAADSLQSMINSGEASFDFVFIDADKPGYVHYIDQLLKLVHSGSMIVADNVIRKGGITDPHSKDENVMGIQRFYERVSNEPLLEATSIQTVGSKGYDGFYLALVK